MFALRSNSYRIFQNILILVFVSSELVNAGQTIKKCAGFNEYCLNHWDCCSNSCMSYMYRCTRGYNVYPYPFLGVSYKPTVTLEQILEQNFGNQNALPTEKRPYFVSRFGGVGDQTEESTATEIQIVLKSSEENTTLKKNDKQNNAENIVENRLAEILGLDEKQNSNNEVLTTTEAEGSAAESSSFKQNNDKVLSTTDSVPISSSTVKPQCSEIGVKCYTNDECCTKRCHGFLHQCVT